MNIYVGNLNYRLEEQDLQDVFQEFGEVTSVKIVKDRMSGRAKGFGFVEMANDSEAEAAINALDGREVMGRPLKVNKAKPREQKETRERW